MECIVPVFLPQRIAHSAAQPGIRLRADGSGREWGRFGDYPPINELRYESGAVSLYSRAIQCLAKRPTPPLSCREQAGSQPLSPSTQLLTSLSGTRPCFSETSDIVSSAPARPRVSTRVDPAGVFPVCVCPHVTLGRSGLCRGGPTLKGVDPACYLPETGSTARLSTDSPSPAFPSCVATPILPNDLVLVHFYKHCVWSACLGRRKRS